MSRPAITAPPDVDEGDEDARDDEQQQAQLEDPLAPEYVTQRARRHDDGGAHERVAGHRPLQGRRPTCPCPRRWPGSRMLTAEVFALTTSVEMHVAARTPPVRVLVCVPLLTGILPPSGHVEVLPGSTVGVTRVGDLTRCGR